MDRDLLRELGLPVVVLVVLVVALAGLLIPILNRPKVEKGPPPLPKQHQEWIEKAEAALDQGNAADALSILDPLKQGSNLKLRLLLAEATLRQKPGSASAAVALEREVGKDRGLDLVWRLARLFDAEGNLGRSRGLLDEMARSPLPAAMKPKVFTALGQAAAALKDEKSALEAFRKAIQTDPKNEVPFLRALDLLGRAGKDAEWESILAAGDAAQAGNVAYHVAVAGFLQGRGDLAEAISRWKKCLSLQPADLEIKKALYKAYRKARQPVEALEILQDLVCRANPIAASMPIPLICFQSAQEARTLDRLDLAARYLRTAFLQDRSLLEKDTDGLLEAVAAYVGRRGTAEQKLFMPIFRDFLNGSYAEARRSMEACLGSFKDEALRRDGERLILECRRVVEGDQAYFAELARLKRLEAAALDKGRLPPSGTMAAAPRKGGSGAGSGLPRAPIRLAKTIAAPAPTRTASQTVPFYLRPKYAARIQEIRNTATEAPSDPSVQFIAGIQLARYKDLAGARELFQQAVNLQPDLGEAHYNLALIAREENNPQEMVTALEQAVKANPQNSKYKSVLARTLMDNGESSSALEFARSSVQVDPANAEGHLVLARIYVEGKQVPEALAAIRQGIEAEREAPSDITEQLQALQKRLAESR